MRRYTGLALIPILLLSSLSGGFCFPIKAKDNLGREIKLLKPPQRIVSLAPTNTEILFVLGLDQNIVGVTDYCNYPEGAKRKEKIGGFANPNIDKIVALKPDLILAFGTLQRPVVQKLERKGQRVFWIYPYTVEEVLASFERIEEITGRATAAKKLKKDVEKRIQDVEQKLGDIPEDKRPSVFRVMGLNPPGTVGGNSFQTDIYRIAGGRNVFTDVKKDFFRIDLKTLIERNPDVIIICGENPEELKQQVRNQEGWQSLTAVKKDRILVISCNLICRPGPRIAETIEKIARYLHPKRFPHYPQRIISLGPAITEELYLLGVENRLVANTIYCQSPPEAKKKEKVGTVIKVNVEKIVSLKPDLVLATSLSDSKQVEKLRSLGIRVVRFSQTQNFSQICQNFLQLGKIAGEEEKARDIVRKATEQIERVTTVIEGLPKPNLFMQVGANPLFTVTQHSFVNELIELAGGINVARGAKSGLYSREQVIAQNPDIILIVTMGVVGEQEKKIWQKFKSINAIRNNNIHIVDSDKVCSPTPLSFVEALKELAAIFHPKAGDKLSPEAPVKK